MRTIKAYSDVKVGDIAFENPAAGGIWNKKEGKVIFVGTRQQLIDAGYEYTMQDWDEETDEDIDEMDLVLVEDEIWGPTLFNYNCDPSGVVVFSDSGQLNEFRKLIGEVDGILNQLTELANDDEQLSEMYDEIFTFQDVVDYCECLKDRITSFQEEMGWI